MAMEVVANIDRKPVRDNAAGTSIEKIDPQGAQNLLVEINRAIADGRIKHLSLAQAVEVEIAIVTAESDNSKSRDGAGRHLLFRLGSRHWAIGDLNSETLVPVGDCQFRVLRFEYDVSELHGASTIADLPMAAAPSPSFVVVFHQEANRNPLIVDAMTARFLELVDGRRTVAEIIRQIDQDDPVSPSGNGIHWVENLFLWGL